MDIEMDIDWIHIVNTVAGINCGNPLFI